MRKRRNEFLDARVTHTARELFRLGCNMLLDGADPKGEEFTDVAFGLNKALKLPPWCEWVLYLEAFSVSLSPEQVESHKWKLPVALHRQLAAAPSRQGR
jgi:hypothetical protein